MAWRRTPSCPKARREEQPRLRLDPEPARRPGGPPRSAPCRSPVSRPSAAEPVPEQGRVGTEADGLLEGRPRELVRPGVLVRASQAAPGGAGGRVAVDRLLQLRAAEVRSAPTVVTVVLRRSLLHDAHGARSHPDTRRQGGRAPGRAAAPCGGRVAGRTSRGRPPAPWRPPPQRLGREHSASLPNCRIQRRICSSRRRAVAGRARLAHA